MKPTHLSLQAALFLWIPISMAASCTSSEMPPENTASDEDSIVGGNKADPGEWPWQALLLVEGHPFCGGALVHEQWVVTAASCAYSAGAADIEVRLGEHQRSKSEGNEQIRKAKEIIIHPNYIEWTADDDIALLRLDAPIALDYGSARAVTLMKATGEEELVTDGTLGFATGWGAKNSDLLGMNAMADTLREVPVPIVSNDICNVPYEGAISNDMLCGGSAQGQYDACWGDEGGPLVVWDPGSLDWKLVGVISMAVGCGQKNNYTVYTKISSYTSWIMDHILLSGSSSCASRCCDNSIIDEKPQPDANQCIFWAGFGCGEKDGPVRIRYGGTIVWSADDNECNPSTMKPCKTQCCNGTEPTIGDQFSKEGCNLFAITECNKTGGGSNWVMFKDQLISDGTCP